MFNEKYQYNHSSIINYPIDYNIFPLAKKSKIIKVELNENQYIHIPAYWSHWVYTEPRTIALSFDIKDILGAHDFKSEIQHKIMQRIPYKKNGKKNKFNYDSFINNSLKYMFNAILSDTNDVSPVFKNEKQKKFFKRDNLSNLINRSLTDNYNVYIGQYDIPTENNFKEITDFINFDKETKNKYESILFDFYFVNEFLDNDPNFRLILEPKIWLTLDKSVNSGLHNDDQSKFLYVLSGKKTVYLASPSENENLYYKLFSIVPKDF